MRLPVAEHVEHRVFRVNEVDRPPKTFAIYLENPLTFERPLSPPTPPKPTFRNRPTIAEIGPLKRLRFGE